MTILLYNKKGGDDLIKIETERLIIREYERDDIPKLYEISNEENILKWMPDWEGTLEKRYKWFEWLQGSYRTSTKEKAAIVLGVTLKDSGDLIGMIGVGNKEEVDNEIEVGYFVSEKYSGKGYTTEASFQVSRWAIKYFGLEYIMAIVELDNYPSQKVLEKSGYKKCGKKNLKLEGYTEHKPFYYYRLYRDEI